MNILIEAIKLVFLFFCSIITYNKTRQTLFQGPFNNIKSNFINPLKIIYKNNKFSNICSPISNLKCCFWFVLILETQSPTVQTATTVSTPSSQSVTGTNEVATGTVFIVILKLLLKNVSDVQRFQMSIISLWIYNKKFWKM